jgi:hypothetical protein
MLPNDFKLAGISFFYSDAIALLQHSPDERASIKSSQKFWKFVIEILENIPVKK